MSTLPLTGRRVAITRASGQASGLADRLRDVGAEPVIVPLIEIVEPDDAGAALAAALAHVDEYEWLVVTSPNGAARVGDAVAAAPRTKLAVVGTATAATLRDVSGRSPDLVPGRQITAGLLDIFPSGRGRILLAQAAEAAPELAAGLVAKGWQVDVVTAYRTIALRPSSRDLLAALSADAVLFASGSAVRSWYAAFGDASPPVAIAIGPATGAVAAELGLKIDAIATDHSLDGLIGELLIILGGPD